MKSTQIKSEHRYARSFLDIESELKIYIKSSFQTQKLLKIEIRYESKSSVFTNNFPLVMKNVQEYLNIKCNSILY